MRSLYSLPTSQLIFFSFPSSNEKTMGFLREHEQNSSCLHSGSHCQRTGNLFFLLFYTCLNPVALEKLPSRCVIIIFVFSRLAQNTKHNTSLEAETCDSYRHLNSGYSGCPTLPLFIIISRQEEWGKKKPTFCKHVEKVRRISFLFLFSLFPVFASFFSSLFFFSS